MAKRVALGSGLGELLGDVRKAYEKNLSEYTESIIELSVDIIKPNPFQPRKTFDEAALQDLANSLIEHGQLQPILVMDKEGEYFVIAGERRLRASKIAKKSTIKAVVADIDEGRLREIAIIENIQRENLNPIDLAQSYKELISEYGITHEELARRIKKSRAQITNTLRILDLSEHVQNLLMQGKITQGHAKIMVGLDEESQRVVADSIIGQKLSVHQTENLVKNFKNPRTNTKNTASLKAHSSTPYTLAELQQVFLKLGIEAQLSAQSITIQPKKDKIRFLIQRLKT